MNGGDVTRRGQALHLHHPEQDLHSRLIGEIGRVQMAVEAGDQRMVEIDHDHVAVVVRRAFEQMAEHDHPGGRLPGLVARLGPGAAGIAPLQAWASSTRYSMAGPCRSAG